MSLHVITTTTMDTEGVPRAEQEMYIKMVCNWCHAFDIRVFKMIDWDGKSSFRQEFYREHRHDRARDRRNRKVRGVG